MKIKRDDDDPNAWPCPGVYVTFTFDLPKDEAVVKIRAEVRGQGASGLRMDNRNWYRGSELGMPEGYGSEYQNVAFNVERFDPAEVDARGLLQPAVVYLVGAL